MTRHAWPLLALLLAMASCEARVRADDAVEISRLVAHESGLSSPGDADAIVAVLLNGSARTGMTPLAFARVYAPRWAAQATPQQWVWRLDERGSDPQTSTDWRIYRPRWLALVERCRVALASPPICVATDWSSPSHMRRRLRRGAAFRVVSCGLTVNVFAVRGER